MRRYRTRGPVTAPDGDDSLAALHDDIWQRLGRGVADRRAPARHPVLASAGRGGGAEARVVVLRGAARSRAELEIHTDTLSAKVAELTADPRASLVIWDPRARLQMRLRAQVAIATGPAVADRWARVPGGSRRAYGGLPAPATPIDSPTQHDPAPSEARFAVLTCALHEIDALHLGDTRHRRALFRRADGWTGQWIAP